MRTVHAEARGGVRSRKSAVRVKNGIDMGGMRMSVARRVLIIAFAAGIVGLGVLPAEAGAMQQIRGRFTAHFPKGGQQTNVYPCPPNVLCGVGSIRGLGAAEIDVFDGNFQPIAGTNCLSFDKEDDVSLLDTGSRLVLVGSGTVCFPGDSGDVPSNPSNRDYGHPSFWTSDLSVVGAQSTGVFSGAKGTVTEYFTVAGGVGLWQLVGSIAQ